MKKNGVISLMNYHHKARVRKKNWHRFVKDNLIPTEIKGNDCILKNKHVRIINRGE